ncbi:2-oxoisovalerate dehydrogenase E1 component, alpha subunit [Cladophialophora psammophila CBS 110553]|uniref:2-oxoisovalerate dehydrogenase subunit alpha n=1 Tax=Cladophialophora psammophila CBS 110553 TaxID=1182543 RepID=W9Y0X2_9EURO|nr:2-oxoisovalerate dehydrogenase E1 component, alpha subunit [Cladophialophora psammophila CBS 110553]EXJ76149.1 2-oxoisovalerate dehydrogenase E1 component, alpha subunit [Cladophialophora psammophila CBS 110553]
MDFLIPKSLPPIATYRVMNVEGRVQDEARADPDVTDEQVLEWYKNMLTVNILDTIMSEAQRQGRLSFYMGSSGEEGIMVGSAAALGPDDVITCQYRETGVFKQRGYTLKDFMSQLMHNKNDPGKGRNMPCHYSGRLKTGVHAVASTLGTQIPHATGAAYALKLADRETGNKSPRVAAAYFGDGAASEGDFHGALNLAAVRDCPVIFICRNNGFAISTPTTEQYRGDGIASRGIGYGIETLRVDGTDIFAVYEATKEARRRALENGGRPILLEMMSYRISHHSTSDDSFAYRTQDEMNTWKTRDNPISRLKKWLENKGLWNDEMDKETRNQIRKDILTELKAAEREKKPPLSSVFDDVYGEYSEEQEAQRKELKRLMLKYPEEYDVEEYEGGINAL